MNYDYLYPKKEKFPFFNSESIVSEIKTIKFEDQFDRKIYFGFG